MSGGVPVIKIIAETVGATSYVRLSLKTVWAMTEPIGWGGNPLTAR